MDARLDRHIYARAKRFRELWTADDRFRKAVEADPQAAAEAAGLDIDTGPLEPVWNHSLRADISTPEGYALMKVDQRSRDYLDFCADDAGAPESYIAWRKRQKARAGFAQGYVVAPIGLHLPYTVELTRGCSMGCWFCGLSAARLEAAVPTDLAAWERMLRALARPDVFGESAVRGFLYWATDPFDHPDYEAYGDTFARVLGRFPATTTAAPMIDPARTRRAMARARAGNAPSMRFSVVSLRQLENIHNEFDVDELADVELVMVNRESVLGLAQAGHVREKARRIPDRAEHERRKLSKMGDDDEIFAHRTIACVSGLIVEPVIGRIRLISMEPCSDRWPDGYVVFDEARFDPAGAEGFEDALTGLVARNMSGELPDTLALQRGVSVTAVAPREVRAEGRGHWVSLRAGRRALGHMPALADAFRGGARVETVAADIARRFEIPPRRVREDAAALWRQGALIETIFDFADLDETPAPAPKRKAARETPVSRREPVPAGAAP